jgi:hypothetical protein
LPDDQQEPLKLNVSMVIIFTIHFAKAHEADIVKAANLSDIHFIDPAKDVEVA